jgi:acetyl esterase
MSYDPELLPFIAKSRAAWPVPGHQLPLGEWREKYETLCAASRPALPAGLTITDALAGEPTTPVRIYLPPGDPQGTIIYMHGGGWVIGSVESHHDITADLARDTRMAVVSVDYSRAPEHAFPRAYQEVLGVVRWAVQGGMQPHGCAARAVLVAGDSAGGNLATAAALALATDGIRLAGQILLYPCVDTDFQRPSWLAAADTPFLNGPQMEWFWRQYAPTARARQDWRAVPMRATDLQLKAAPPAFITAAQHDPLRDEGIAYAQRLRQAGCPVHLDEGQGLVHGYIRLRHAAQAPGRIYREMCGWATARAQEWREG